MRSVDALGGAAVDALGGVAIDALGRTAGTGGGKVEELAVEIGVGCGLHAPQASSSETGEGCGFQVPQASSSESSIAMVGATARADDWAALPAADCSLRDNKRSEAQR